MAFLGGLAGIATVVSTLGTIVGAAGAIAQGQNAKAQAEYQAKLQEIKGTEDQAAQQRKALDKQHQGMLIQSKLQAGAAASGAGASDPTIINLSEDVAGRTAYEAGLLNWSGLAAKDNALNTATAYKAAGDAAEQQGNLTALGGLFKAGGTLIGGSSSSMFDTYNPMGSQRRVASSLDLDPLNGYPYRSGAYYG